MVEVVVALHHDGGVVREGGDAADVGEGLTAGTEDTGLTTVIEAIEARAENESSEKVLVRILSR